MIQTKISNKPKKPTITDFHGRRMILLLSEIWNEGSISRARLAKITGQALPSITRFVQALKIAGVVIENDKGESSGGRHPSLIRLNPEAGVVIGLDFSGIELRCAILDSTNHCLLVAKQPFLGMQAETIQHQVIQLCHQLFADPVIQNRRVLGIGISVPGTVDIAKGIICDSSNMHLHNIPVRSILEGEFGVPVFIDHDTSAAALAEKYYGAGRGESDLIYITVSTGIGAGIIVNHEVYRGTTGQAGELGHITIERDGQVCACGKHGCLEAVAAVPAMLASTHNILLHQQNLPFTAVVGTSQETLSLQVLKIALEQGDPLAQAILNRATDYLALAVSMMVSIIDIRLMIIGGEVIQMGEPYLTALRKSIIKYQVGEGDIRVVPAILGETAALQGVGLITLQNILTRAVSHRVIPSNLCLSDIGLLKPETAPNEL